MKPVSRRQALVLALTGTGAVVVGGGGLLLAGGDGTDAEAGAALIEPPALEGADGLLDVRLEAGPSRTAIGGRTASMWLFNGTLPGPTLRVRPGDSLRINVANRLQEPTNLHVHGLHVSPAGHGDNPFVSIPPGGSFDYSHTLPRNHSAGTFWYHPHHHGRAAAQLAAGLYGAIVVLADVEDVPVTRERVLIVSDVSLGPGGRLRDPSPAERMTGREGAIVLVNGQFRPAASAAAGDRELWRVVNACPARYLRLRLDGGRMQVLALDGHRLPAPSPADDVLLAPGNRADLLATVGPGGATLRTAGHARGTMGAMMGGNDPVGSRPAELFSVGVPGDAAASGLAAPPTVRQRDLRAQPLARRRRVELSMGMGGMGFGMGGGADDAHMAFLIDGKQFDPGRTDQTVSVGTVEEWTLVNSSPMDHPLHLHVWPMQVLRDADGDHADPLWKDVVNVPANGAVTVLIAFDDFPGRSVFHCHILDHEDLGMMGTVQAVREATGSDGA